MAEEESLLHSDDEIFLDDTITMNLTASDRLTPTLGSKRKRDSEDESDISALDLSVSGEKVEHRRLKKKKAKQEAQETDALDAYLEDLETHERDGLSSTVVLADKLFQSNDDDDDDDESDSSPTPQKTKKSALDDIRKHRLVLGTDDDLMHLERSGEEDAVAAAVDRDEISLPQTMLASDGVPILPGCSDVVNIRCTYAAQLKNERWSPFRMDMTEEATAMNLAVDESQIVSLLWGVFTVHVASDEGDSSGRRRNTSSASFDVSEAIHPNMKPNQVPWFICLGNEELLQHMLSPFFRYRTRMVRVDPRFVRFEWRRYVPIFYVFGLDEKIPLWPLEDMWSPSQLIHLLVDTLYAHVEYVRAKEKDSKSEEICRKVLLTIDGFPLAVSKPSEQLLPPNKVPLNNYSSRKDRNDHLRKLILDIFKNHSVPVNGNGQRNTIVKVSQQDAILLARCMGGLVTPAAYLFADIEKPPHIWETIANNQYIPIHVLSKISNWQSDSYDVVQKRILSLKDALPQLTNPTTHALAPKISALYALHSFLAFDIVWFEDWFVAARDGKNRTDRLELYAFFAAATLWRAIREEEARYGSHASFLFTATRRHDLFDCDFIWTSQNRKASTRYNGETVTSVAQPLTSDEQQQILQHALDHVMAINREYKEPYVLHEDIFKRITSAALIDKKRFETSKKLARLALTITLFYKTIKTQIEPALLQGLPPIIVQMGTTYSLAGQKMTDAIREQLRQVFGTNMASDVLVIGPMARALDIVKTIKTCQAPRVLLFDLFHVWALDQVHTVIAELTKTKVLQRCTHLIVTGLANSCGAIGGGGSLIWELLEVAEITERLLRMESSAIGEGADFFRQIQQQKRQLYNRQALVNRLHENATHLDDLAQYAYPLEERRSQFQLNQSNFHLFAEFKTYREVCHKIFETYERTKQQMRLFFVYIRHISKQQIKQTLKAKYFGIVSSKNVSVSCVTYHDLEMNALLLKGATHVVLVDVDYEGYGRCNYMHFNTVFEHCQKRIYAVRSTPFQGRYHEERAVTLDDITNIFYRNDIKSSRYLMAIGRCPLLTEFYQQDTNKSGVASVLQR